MGQPARVEDGVAVLDAVSGATGGFEASRGLAAQVGGGTRSSQDTPAKAVDVMQEAIVTDDDAAFRQAAAHSSQAQEHKNRGSSSPTT